MHALLTLTLLALDQNPPPQTSPPVADQAPPIAPEPPAVELAPGPAVPPVAAPETPVLAPVVVPPPPARAGLRILVLDWVAHDGAPVNGRMARGVAVEQLSELRTATIVEPSEILASPVASAALQQPGAVDDARILAVVGASVRADKVLGGSVAQSGPLQTFSTHFVDVATARSEWRQSATTDATRESAIQALQDQSAALGAYLGRTYAPGSQPLPPMAAPPVAPVAAPSPTPRRWLSARRAVGITLLAAGAGLAPVSLGALALTGLGHVAGSQLALSLPCVAPAEGGGAPTPYPCTRVPKYYSPSFRLTWGDFALSAVIATGALVVMGAGGVLTALP